MESAAGGGNARAGEFLSPSGKRVFNQPCAVAQPSARNKRCLVSITHTPPAFAGRLTFIDGLRGIAAFSVVCYHVARYEPETQLSRRFIPEMLQTWFDHGWIGVQVFFVISGFVIAYSLRNAFITPGYAVNYAWRRSIRLDPSYWATILFVLVLHAVLHLHLGFDSPLDIPSKMEPALSWQLLASHVLYLQNILEYDNLSAGFWTLCIEVQFYVLFVVGQGIAQRLPCASRRTPADAGSVGLFTVFAPLSLLSLFVWNGGIDLAGQPYDNDMWIIRYLAMFFLGSLAWWALDGRIPRWSFWLYAGAMAGRILLHACQTNGADDLTIGLSTALVTGVSIYTVGRLGRLGTWLDFSILQYLGRISYSLYLIHFPVGHIVSTIAWEVSGRSPSPVVATLWLALAIAASVAVAHLMYVFIEAPSVRLAARFKRPASETTAKSANATR